MAKISAIFIKRLFILKRLTAKSFRIRKSIAKFTIDSSILALYNFLFQITNNSNN